MVVDCGRCEMRGVGCRDCVITSLSPAPAARSAAQAPVQQAPVQQAPVHLPEAEVKALGVLAAAGLVPPLRLSLAGPAVRPGTRAWTRQVLPDAKAS